MLKTTVYLDADAYRRLKNLAYDEHRSPAELVREAVSEYVARHARPAPTCIGSAETGVTDRSERVDELLDGFGT